MAAAAAAVLSLGCWQQQWTMSEQPPCLVLLLPGWRCRCCLWWCGVWDGECGKAWCEGRSMFMGIFTRCPNGQVWHVQHVPCATQLKLGLLMQSQFFHILHCLTPFHTTRTLAHMPPHARSRTKNLSHCRTKGPDDGHVLRQPCRASAALPRCCIPPFPSPLTHPHQVVNHRSTHSPPPPCAPSLDIQGPDHRYVHTGPNSHVGHVQRGTSPVPLHPPEGCLLRGHRSDPHQGTAVGDGPAQHMDTARSVCHSYCQRCRLYPTLLPVGCSLQPSNCNHGNWWQNVVYHV